MRLGIKSPIVNFTDTKQSAIGDLSNIICQKTKQINKSKPKIISRHEDVSSWVWSRPKTLLFLTRADLHLKRPREFLHHENESVRGETEYVERMRIIR